jgi:hypothetical protein
LDIFSIQDKRVPIAVGIVIGVGVGIGIGIEGQKMGFGHEKLDVTGHRSSMSAGPIVREDQPQFTVGIDPDPDSDPDTDGNQEQTDRQQLATGG